MFIVYDRRMNFCYSFLPKMNLLRSLNCFCYIRLMNHLC